MVMRNAVALALVLGGAGCGVDDDARPSAPLDGSLRVDAGIDLDGPGDTGAPLPACDPLRNEGCAGAVCKLLETPRCVETSTSGLGRGEPCAPGACAVGLGCLRATETATAARCLKLCDLESGLGCEELPGDYECRLRIDDLPWGACTELPPTCNPYSQTPCPDDEGCQPFLRRTGARDLRCQPAGSRPVGSTCGIRIGACVRGAACVADPDRPDEPAVCRAYCELNADCPSPQQCTGRVDDPAFGFCLP